MNFKKRLRKFQNNYVLKKVANTKTPNFKSSNTVRKEIIFSGKVQKVGFRFEAYELAKKLGLTGFVKNKLDNTVYLEAQGEEDKILFLIDNMKALKRAKVSNVEIKDLPLVKEEKDFIIDRG